jgi:hypothetical protein
MPPEVPAVLRTILMLRRLTRMSKFVAEGETPRPIPAAAKGQPDLTLATYRLGRSYVTEVELDKYVTQGLIKPTLHGLCRALGREEVPCPEPYEAVIFSDFFVVGLRFPCEDFVGEVLQRFNLQIRHLTPNTFAQPSIFAMALKMSGCALSVNIFTCHCETHFHKKTIKDRQTKAEMVAHFGSYNFIQKKTKGTI